MRQFAQTVVCPPKRATCLSIKKGNLSVPQKGNLSVPYKVSPVYPSKRATYLSPKKGNLYIPQKGQPIYPPKRTTCLPLSHRCSNNSYSLLKTKSTCISQLHKVVCGLHVPLSPRQQATQDTDNYREFISVYIVVIHPRFLTICLWCLVDCLCLGKP